jgi:hypothetical protein
MSGEKTVVQQEGVIDQVQNQEAFVEAFVEAVPEAKDEVDAQPVGDETTVEDADKRAAEAEATRKAEEAKKVAADTPDYEKLYKETVQKTKSWEGRLSAADRRANEAEAKLKEVAAVTPKPAEILLNEEEQKVLDAFTAEMGEDFIKPLTILLKRAIAESTGKVTKEVESLKTTVATAKTTAESASKTLELDVATKHWETIETAHPDVEKLLDPIDDKGQKTGDGPVTTWAKTLPYVEAQKALATIEKGKTSEVVKLLTDYKKATGAGVKQKDTTAEDAHKRNKAAAVRTGGPVIIPRTELNKDDFTGTFEAITADDKK